MLLSLSIKMLKKQRIYTRLYIRTQKQGIFRDITFFWQTQNPHTLASPAYRPCNKEKANYANQIKQKPIATVALEEKKHPSRIELQLYYTKVNITFINNKKQEGHDLRMYLQLY